MIRFVRGNIFDSHAHALVNTVNCDGIMGKGLAFQFKSKFPENHSRYVSACKSKSLSAWRVLLVEDSGRIVVNFPTKGSWKEKSKYGYISAWLSSLAGKIRGGGIESVAIPPLWCGNGWLDWKTVRKMITDILSPVSNVSDIEVYEPTEWGVALGEKHLVLMEIRKNSDRFDYWNMYAVLSELQSSGLSVPSEKEAILLVGQIKNFLDASGKTADEIGDELKSRLTSARVEKIIGRIRSACQGNRNGSREVTRGGRQKQFII